MGVRVEAKEASELAFGLEEGAGAGEVWCTEMWTCAPTPPVM